MPASTTQTSIANRGLQILGYPAITSIGQPGDRGAKAMNRAYQPVHLSELQKNYWHFATLRAQLAASATAPLHSKAYAYPLPNDYIMLAPEDQFGNYPEKKDWIIESGHIITDDQAPLKIRYISSAVTEAMFDAIYAEALSAALAVATGEELTQSNTKVERAMQIYLEQINLARKRGSILTPKARLPVSPWISMRG